MAGWTRLSAGRRKRRAAASAAGTGMGSLGHGASSSAAGDGDGRGPDDRSVDATLSCFGGGGGSLLPPPVNCCDPWTAMARTVGISGRVIGLSSR